MLEPRSYILVNYRPKFFNRRWQAQRWEYPQHEQHFGFVNLLCIIAGHCTALAVQLYRAHTVATACTLMFLLWRGLKCKIEYDAWWSRRRKFPNGINRKWLLPADFSFLHNLCTRYRYYFLVHTYCAGTFIHFCFACTVVIKVMLWCFISVNLMIFLH